MNASDHPNSNKIPSAKANDFDGPGSPYGEGFTKTKDPNVTYGRRASHRIGSCVSKMGEMLHGCLDRCENSEVVNISIDRGGWLLIVPYTVGVILFLVGWFLSAEAVRVLWLLITGLIAVVGFVGLVMVYLIIRDRSQGGHGKGY
ncbi:hypothetical protein Ga0123462_0730 [Mariprofundus ferrinatatus]|uniref:Uncharacterized protein n=1 Tax=Mariprofundus ferrinatatus TaxID=1921087 RepID=A0A2K8L2P0_9PROT|nr:hypothetical protein [Mariprofundus ferrinatatus]ATX81600.1 hypothetical protein Ga0123462_0730 [Mariprofundus ferrinatatus]